MGVHILAGMGSPVEGVGTGPVEVVGTGPEEVVYTLAVTSQWFYRVTTSEKKERFTFGWFRDCTFAKRF